MAHVITPDSFLHRLRLAHCQLFSMSGERSWDVVRGSVLGMPGALANGIDRAWEAIHAQLSRPQHDMAREWGMQIRRCLDTARVARVQWWADRPLRYSVNPFVLYRDVLGMHDSVDLVHAAWKTFLHNLDIEERARVDGIVRRLFHEESSVETLSRLYRLGEKLLQRRSYVPRWEFWRRVFSLPRDVSALVLADQRSHFLHAQHPCDPLLQLEAAVTRPAVADAIGPAILRRWDYLEHAHAIANLVSKKNQRVSATTFFYYVRKGEWPSGKKKGAAGNSDTLSYVRVRNHASSEERALFDQYYFAATGMEWHCRLRAY